jgi:hypothetical protein
MTTQPRIVRRVLTGAGILAMLALGACVAGSAEAQHAASGGPLSELLLGMWHGLIAPVMLIVEVINQFAPRLLPWTARFYQPHDSSAVYDIGFYVGLIGSPLLIGVGWSRRR